MELWNKLIKWSDTRPDAYQNLGMGRVCGIGFDHQNQPITYRIAGVINRDSYYILPACDPSVTVEVIGDDEVKKKLEETCWLIVEDLFGFEKGVSGASSHRMDLHKLILKMRIEDCLCWFNKIERAVESFDKIHKEIFEAIWKNRDSGHEFHS